MKGKVNDFSAGFVREVTAKYIGPRRKSATIRGPEDVARFMRGILRDEVREHFIALYLNGAHQVVSFSLVSLGTANAAPVHPREIFQGAVITGAVSVVVGHNHPSGELTPSSDDITVTKRLREAGDLIGIKVLDHVLFSKTDYVSFQERGF